MPQTQVEMPILGMWTTMYWEFSAEDAVRHLAELGWRHIDLACEHLCEIADGGPERIEAFASLLTRLNIDPWQAHATLDLNVIQGDEHLHILLRQIDQCARLGVRCVVVHPGAGPKAPGGMTRDEVLRRNVQAFQTATQAAERAGVHLAVENMGRSEFGGSIADLLDLIDAVGSSRLAICFDSVQANVAGLNVPGAIRLCGPLLGCLHLHDNDAASDQHRMPGGGNIDWFAVVQALREVNYRGPLCLEILGENKCPIPLRDAKLAAIRQILAFVSDPSNAACRLASRRESIAEFCRRGLVGTGSGAP